MTDSQAERMNIYLSLKILLRDSTQGTNRSDWDVSLR